MTTLKNVCVSLGYHLEINQSEVWWPTADQTKLWIPHQSAQDYRILLAPPFAFLAEKVAPDSDSFHPVSGVKILGALIGSERFAAGFLREKVARVDDLLSLVAEMNDPKISTEMHRMCVFIVQIVHILHVTPPEQAKPMLYE